MKNFDDYNLLLLPNEVCEILRISKSAFYKKVWQGDLPVIKIGKSLRIDKNQLIEFLNKNTRNGNENITHS